MDIQVDTRDIAAMARRYRGAERIVREEMVTAMNRAVLPVEADAKRTVAVDTGHLRRSITHQVRQIGGGVEGKVGTNVQYARVVEEGRRAGAAMPPSGVLAGWMRRTNIPYDREYLIRRAIARRGIKARPYLKPAIVKNRARISREFAAVPGRVMKRLAVGR